MTAPKIVVAGDAWKLLLEAIDCTSGECMYCGTYVYVETIGLVTHKKQLVCKSELCMYQWVEDNPDAEVEDGQ